MDKVSTTRNIQMIETMKFRKATYLYWRKRFNRLNPDQEIDNQMFETRKERKITDVFE